MITGQIAHCYRGEGLDKVDFTTNYDSEKGVLRFTKRSGEKSDGSWVKETIAYATFYKGQDIGEREERLARDSGMFKEWQEVRWWFNMGRLREKNLTPLSQ